MLKGLGNLANIASLIKQAQQLSGPLGQVLEDLKSRRAEGSAGGGMVVVQVNGLGEVVSCRIEPAAFKPEDRELVEELIATAANQALAKSRQMHAEALHSLTGMSGLGSMLAQLSGGKPGDGGSGSC